MAKEMPYHWDTCDSVINDSGIYECNCPKGMLPPVILTILREVKAQHQKELVEESLKHQRIALCIALDKFNDFGSKAKVFDSISREIDLLEAEISHLKLTINEPKP